MEYKRLGHSGLQVSRIILGCMGFGDPSRGTHEWAIGIDEARPIIRQALEAGITTFDTANVYSLGASEEIVGQVLGELTKRDDVIIATKVFSRMGPGPKDAGLSRAAIFAQVEQSLQRLKTDYIDLYQIHRYDPNTPIEETMEALHDLVKSGKVRYIGASSMYAWQFAQAQYVADLHGWTRFVSMQDQYNLLMREAIRRRVTEHGGSAEYRDPVLFERVWSLLGHAAEGRNPDFLLLPELLDESGDWDLRTQLSLSSHRPALGPIILLVKRRVLLPLSRWLLEYTRENFRRQHRVNRLLFACIEELAIENARLRRELELERTETTEETGTHREAEKRRQTE